MHFKHTMGLRNRFYFPNTGDKHRAVCVVARVLRPRSQNSGWRPQQHKLGYRGHNHGFVSLVSERLEIFFNSDIRSSSVWHISLVVSYVTRRHTLAWPTLHLYAFKNWSLLWFYYTHERFYSRFYPFVFFFILNSKRFWFVYVANITQLWCFHLFLFVKQCAWY